MRRKEEKSRKDISSGMSRMRGSLKQLCYPKEFRIGPAIWPSELIDTLEKLVQPSTPAPVEMPPEAKADEEAAQREHFRFLADVGTGLWRLRQKMVQPGTDRPLEEMRRAFRHLESVWDALTQAGMEIRDHTGEPVPEGGVYALKTVAFQPTPGISREKVIETIKPSIYYKDQMIQMGEVIVGTPETPSNPTESFQAKEGKGPKQNG